MRQQLCLHTIYLSSSKKDILRAWIQFRSERERSEGELGACARPFQLLEDQVLKIFLGAWQNLFQSDGYPFAKGQNRSAVLGATLSLLVIYLPMPRRQKSNRCRLGFLARWQISVLFREGFLDPIYFLSVFWVWFPSDVKIWIVVQVLVFL